MIDALSYRHWAISQQFANTLGVIALRLLAEGRSIEHLVKKLSHVEILERYQSRLVTSSASIITKVSWDSESGLYIATTKQGQNVAMIPVFGALTKRGDLCSYGMRDYIRMIDRANGSDKIAGIVLDTESPGGTVDGTQEFALAVRSSKKPVVTFGDGMVASAAYWVSSQSHHIVANKHNPTEFGSIGVLYVHENYQAYIAKEIGEIEIIRAPQSVDKARVNVIEPLTDDQRADIRTELKDIATEFISVVKNGRGTALKTDDENIFTGKMYPASQALELGMIDSLGTIQDAVNLAASLSSASNSNSISNNKSMNVKHVARRASSFFKKKKAAAVKAAEEEPAAADDNIPMWTADMVFNTDGSGDGAFCLHPDDEGNDRKFETKVDDNQGNEPPTDPTVMENDFWSVVAEAENEEEPENEPEASANVTMAKLNRALKEANATVKAQAAQIASLKQTVADQKAELDKAPAGHATTPVADSDPEEGKKDKSKFHTSVDDEVAKYESISKSK